ncbi:hypothetical protein GCM10023212_24480 [Luteolibacter yonseiensis]
MDYQSHLKAHSARQEAEASRRRQSDADRLIALRVSCEDAEKIIREIIEPELEKMRAAIETAGRECTLKVSRRKVHDISSEFEIEINIRSVKRTLHFQAKPQDRAFMVSHYDSGNAFDGSLELTFLYSDITTAFVLKKCEEFMRAAFPV